jgi:hypothetical protein
MDDPYPYTWHLLKPEAFPMHLLTTAKIQFQHFQQNTCQNKNQKCNCFITLSQTSTCVFKKFYRSTDSTI